MPAFLDPIIVVPGVVIVIAVAILLHAIEKRRPWWTALFVFTGIGIVVGLSFLWHRITPLLA